MRFLCLGLFPAYASLASWGASRWAARVYVAVAMLMSAVQMALFALWRWVA